MTDDELNAIEARANAATLPPLRTSGSKTYVIPSHGEPYKVAQLGGSVENPGLIARDDEHLQHDTEFIAHARTDVPALVAEIRRLRSARCYHAIEIDGQRAEYAAPTPDQLEDVIIRLSPLVVDTVLKIERPEITSPPISRFKKS